MYISSGSNCGLYCNWFIVSTPLSNNASVFFSSFSFPSTSTAVLLSNELYCLIACADLYTAAVFA
jgi:hypothetical protein